MKPSDQPVDDTSCPVAFVAIPAVLGVLLWLVIMFARMSHF
jgi:hypothetical protein